MNVDKNAAVVEPGTTTQLDSINAYTLLEAIVNGLDEEMVVIAPDFHILFVNQSLLSRLGKTQQDVVGDFCYRVSHGRETPCQLMEHECPLRTVLETGKPVSVTHNHSAGHSKKMAERYVSVTASPITDKEGNVIAVTELMRDITDSRLMEMRTVDTYRGLLALGTISSVVSESLNLDTVLDSALDKLLEIMKTDIGGILLFDEEKQLLCYEVNRGFRSDYVTKVCYPPDEDIDGQVFKSGEIFITENARNDSRTFNSSLVAAEGIESLLIAPLRAKGKILGVLNIANRTPRKFSPEDINFLLSAAPQIALAVENAKLHREVEYKEQVRGELLKEIFTIQEEERRRIARELHDETSQALAGLAANLEVLLQMPAGEIDKIRINIKKAQNISLNILDEIHKLIYDLRPTVLDDLGLVSAIRWLATNILGAEGIVFSFKTSGRLKRLPSSSEASLYRAIQEAITNIARHSDAKNVAIGVKFSKTDISVEIVDDGTGFDVEEAINSKERPRGLGLLGMKERIEFMGGELKIDSQPDGRGTRVKIGIPLVCSVPMNSGKRDGEDKGTDR